MKHITEKSTEKIRETGREQLASPSERKARRIIFQTVSGIILILFLVLAVTSAYISYFPFDLSISNSLQMLHSPFFSQLMVLVSWFGYLPQSGLITLIIVVTVYILGFRWEAELSLGIAIFNEIINALLKILIHRPRPAADLVNVVTSLTNFSFPSGHVMYYVTFFGFIWFLIYVLLKKSWLRTILLSVFGFLILSVGLSRIYLGAHWTSDVLGAYFLGTLILIVSIQIYKWGKKRLLTD